jgi:Tfp pilus assembly protein PilX
MVGMILLAIITLLAVVGMNVANSELSAATSEQLRVRAFQAAETGIERGVTDLFDINTAEGVDVPTAATPVEGAEATDQYSLVSRYRGESEMVDGFGKNFRSFHFTVVSNGTAPRNTRAQHVQGAYIVNGTGGQQTFGALPAWAVPVATPPTP